MSISSRIGKLWYIQMVEYCAVVTTLYMDESYKRNIASFATYFIRTIRPWSPGAQQENFVVN